jgi:hypothetical protein
MTGSLKVSAIFCSKRFYLFHWDVCIAASRQRNGKYILDWQGVGSCLGFYCRFRTVLTDAKAMNIVWVLNPILRVLPRRNMLPMDVDVHQPSPVICFEMKETSSRLVSKAMLRAKGKQICLWMSLTTLLSPS